MSGFGTYGARAYTSIGVETGVSTSSPHTLILMLYDGALESLRRAQGCMQAQDTAGKTQALSRATRIIDEGLRASLDHKTGANIAAQLDSLYDYMCRRTLHANMENDPAPVEEVAHLLGELREAWAAIAPGSTIAA